MWAPGPPSCSLSTKTNSVAPLIGGQVPTAQSFMGPSKYSDMNTARKGVTRSLMPWTYPLAGCLHGSKWFCLERCVRVLSWERPQAAHAPGPPPPPAPTAGPRCRGSAPGWFAHPAGRRKGRPAPCAEHPLPPGQRMEVDGQLSGRTRRQCHRLVPEKGGPHACTSAPLPLPDLSEGPCFILRGARQASAVVVVWNKVSARHDGGLKGPVESVGSHSWTRRWGLCTQGPVHLAAGLLGKSMRRHPPQAVAGTKAPFPASTPLHTAPACIRGVCVPEWRPASHGWEGRSLRGAASSRSQPRGNAAPG